MATKLIPISVSGSLAHRFDLDGRFARQGDDESDIQAVVRSIARRTRTVCCAGPRLDSWTQGGGTRTYQATFGRHIGGGTYNVQGELWIYV